MAYNCVKKNVNRIDAKVNRRMFARICNCNLLTPVIEARMDGSAVPTREKVIERNMPGAVEEVAAEVTWTPDKSAYEYDPTKS